MENEVKTQWHPALCSAIKLELREDAQYLTYTNEYNLNTKPLQMDMLIIKKPNDVELKNQIGKSFRGHNVIEYKSPKDSLNLDTFIKVKGYACIYKASEPHVDEIDLEDITITLIRNGIPRKLLGWLRTHEYEVVEKYRGIYYISKKHEFPVQVIVSRKLSKEHQKWLTLLTDELKEEDVKRAVLQTNELEEKDERDYADSVLQVVLKANKKIVRVLKEEDRNMCQALRELMAEEFEEELQKAIEKAEIAGREAGLEKGLVEGRAEGLVEGRAEGLVEGRAEGRAEGLAEGALQNMILLVRKNLLSLEIAANEMGFSVEEFTEKMNASGMLSE